MKIKRILTFSGKARDAGERTAGPALRKSAAAPPAFARRANAARHASAARSLPISRGGAMVLDGLV